MCKSMCETMWKTGGKLIPPCQNDTPAYRVRRVKMTHPYQKNKKNNNNKLGREIYDYDTK